MNEPTDGDLEAFKAERIRLKDRRTELANASEPVITPEMIRVGMELAQEEISKYVNEKDVTVIYRAMFAARPKK